MESGTAAVDRDREDDCTLCLEQLPCWDTDRLVYMPCCGQKMCKDCCDKRNDVLRRAVAEGSFGREEKQLNRCCPMCRTELPKDDIAAKAMGQKFDRGHLSLRLYRELGLSYLVGEQGVEQNTEKGLEILMLGAEKGDPCCQYSLGMMYCQGEGGLPNDTAKARRWLLAAAEQGHAVAESQLANILREEGDDAEYLRLLRGSASKGYGPACFDLSRIHYYGKYGVAQSTEEAIRALTPAAERGHAESMWLSGMFLCWPDPPLLPPNNPNFTKGVHWARWAAATGDETAISKLEGLVNIVSSKCFMCNKTAPRKMATKRNKKKVPREKAFLRCSRCRAAWYCSKNCQVQHWRAENGHKQYCIKWE